MAKASPRPAKPPTPGELDVLAAVYELAADQQEQVPLRLTDIHQAVGRRRTRYGEPPPALTTVASQLRALVQKSLLAEEPIRQTAPTRGAVRTRGMFSPTARSSPSGYRPRYEPGEVLRDSFLGLAAAYPQPDRNRRALADFARALGLSDREALTELAAGLGLAEETIKKLAQMVPGG